MKFLLLASLTATATAFNAPMMTFAVGKKAPKKASAGTKVVKKAAPTTGETAVIPAAAIPGEVVPAILDGSLVGDAGFDPCFLSTKADLMADYFNGLFQGRTTLDGLGWYREAELMHGRICQVAVLGFIIPGFVTFGGDYDVTNPLAALSEAPGYAVFQAFGTMAILEFRRILNILEDGPNYQVGNAQRWGQDGWNPFGLDYTPEEYAEKELQEIKHCRLAMIGFLGLVFQANASGINVVQQWSAALQAPEYYAHPGEGFGYFFPEGI